MDNIDHEIRNNLYEFYDKISQFCGIYSEKPDHWSVVKNIPGAWPRVIYRIDSEIVEEQSSAIFSEKVNSGSYPELLIASDENIRQIDPFLRSQGFYPFSAWKGMAFRSVDNVTAPHLPEAIEIVKPENSVDIEQWIEIVTSELITPAKMDKSLLENLIVHPEFDAYLLKNDGVGVSTMLVFKSVNSTGLYLIATRKSAQRQGFASLLVQQIIFHETQKSKNPIILHATQNGEALYSKLNFLPFNRFFLYRYLNTNL